MDEHTLFQIQELLQKCQQNIAECLALCEQRQIIANQPLEVGDNLRQLFRWTWYVDVDDLDVSNTDATQAHLFKNMLSEIQKCKIEGNNTEEYLALQREIEEAIKQFDK